jgi:uncharacterized protein YbgA (DUF1722 family)
MRIWDVCPAYLNQQSLLGEHKELHGIVSILANNKKGDSKHPETLRWVGFGWAIKQRHKMIIAEMSLRGYQDKPSVSTTSNEGKWPTTYIDSPYEQLTILKGKYQNKADARLETPANAQQIWRQHKYSVLARDPNMYKRIGAEVSTMKSRDDFSAVADLLSNTLKLPPSQGGTRNALQHMWGYISQYSQIDKSRVNDAPLLELLDEIQKHAIDTNNSYLCDSTALSELAAWL